MGRRSKTRALSAWMNGERVGTWTFGPQGHQFTYEDSWIQSAHARPLSLSMPLTPAPIRGTGVEDYFDNLLPDSQAIRRRAQTRFGTETSKAFDLLAEIGRDCVGAIQLLEPTAEPVGIREIRGHPLTEAEIAGVLRASHGAAKPTGPDEFRISLAGAQEKTALLWHDGAWHAPRGSTPTTHILKLPLGNVGTWQAGLSTSVENEWLCSKIARGFGLPIAHCEIQQFEDQRVLVVERFDRRLAPDGSWWLRLPQEDLCQATETPSALKYESDGGPGIRTVLDLLLGSSAASTDRRNFLATQILFWILAAPDGHAKNLSIALEPRGSFHLAPLYDVLSAYPVVGHGPKLIPKQDLNMAMAPWGKNKHYPWIQIRPRHWQQTANDCGLREVAEEVFTEFARRAPQVIAAVQEEAGDTPAEVMDPILEGVEAAVAQLEP